jgi:hypothetical protein
VRHIKTLTLAKAQFGDETDSERLAALNELVGTVLNFVLNMTTAKDKQLSDVTDILR